MVSAARQADARAASQAAILAPGALLYAQLVKQRQHATLVAVTTKAVFGDADAIGAWLNDWPTSHTITTSFVEPENLSLRQTNRRLTGKTSGFSKQAAWLEKQLWLSLAYDHLVLPHDSLRHRLDRPAATPGSGEARRWGAATAAMAAGMTDPVWTVAELLAYRVPAEFVDRMSDIDHLFASLEPFHQGN